MTLLNLDPKEALEKLWTDVYVGDGEENRPLTVRMALMEKDVLSQDERLDKIVAAMSRLFWTVLAAALALAADLLKGLILPKG